MKVAIHQPLFFPWLGFLAKMASVEKFVFFDHVQLPRGKSFVYRNRIRLGGEGKWLTLPIRREGASSARICDVEISDPGIGKKHLRTLKLNYGKAGHWAEVEPFLHAAYGKKQTSIADFNIAFLESLATGLGLKTEFVRSSQMEGADGILAEMSGNELVLEVCKRARGTHYLSGRGKSLSFIEPESFHAEGIEFHLQNFVHPQYEQLGFGEFISGLSCLDALLCLGLDGFKDVLDRSCEA